MTPEAILELRREVRALRRTVEEHAFAGRRPFVARLSQALDSIVLIEEALTELERLDMRRAA